MAPESTDTNRTIPTTVGAGIDFSDPNSRLAPFYLTPFHVIAVGFIAGVFAVCTLIPLWHTDIWGHLKYGEWIVDHRAMPDRELFSPWWDGSEKFTQFYTLSQPLLFEIYHLGEQLAGGDEVSRASGGVEMLRLFHGILNASRYLVMLLVFLRLSGGSWSAAFFALAVFLILDVQNVRVFRPQTLAQTYFAVLLFPLSRDLISRRAVFLIPLFIAFWTNCHGSYIVALALLAMIAFGRALDLFVNEDNRRPWRDLQCQRLVWTFVLSFVAAGLLNPYGFSYYQRTLELSRHSSLVLGVSEWQPLTYSSSGSHIQFMASLLLAGLTQLASRRSIAPSRILILAVFGCGMALQSRFIVWWSMIVPWVLLPTWTELAARWERFLPEIPKTPSFRLTLIAAALTWAIFMWSSPAAWLMNGGPAPADESVSSGTPWRLARQLLHPGDPEAVFSKELAQVIATYPNGRFTGSVFASPMQGDYLMWKVSPSIPVTYSHIHLFPPSFWDEVGSVTNARPGWRDVLDKYHANLILIEAEDSPRLKHELARSPDWKIVLDETGNQSKFSSINRQFIAVRLKPR